MQRTVGRFLHTVRHTLTHHAMLAPGAHVLVALSGGADSVATLMALTSLARRLNVTVSAGHVHHGLRGAEADADAVTAKLIAARFNVPFRVTRLSATLRRGGNVEERARQARYAALAKIARACGATLIATGHTRDDQAETVMLRIVRGCGPDGLAAILPIVQIGEATVIRPLLDCTRAEVEQFLAAIQVKYCEDSTNQNPRFLRNRIRCELMPLLREFNPRIGRALADLAALSQERQSLPALAMLAGESPTVTQLLNLPPERRPEAIRAWLESARGDCRGLTKRHIAAVSSLLSGVRPTRRIALPGGSVTRDYDQLHFVPPGTASKRDSRGRSRSRSRREDADPETSSRDLKPAKRLTFNGWQIEAAPIQPFRPGGPLPSDLWTAVLDADVAEPLVVRLPQPGDRVEPLGMRGQRKLSDIFIDRKVPRAVRKLRPVVYAGGKVVWVPGVVRGRVGAVGPRTRHVLWLRAKSLVQPLLG